MNRVRARRSLLVLITSLSIVALATITVLALASGLPDHDAFVMLDDPETPEDESATPHDGQNLDVAASLGPGNVCTPTQTIYLQWDLSELSGGDVDTATLTLTATNTINTGSATLSLYQTTDGWDEDTLTADGAPPVGTLIQAVNAPPAGDPPSPATIAFSNSNLVAYINSQATGDGVVSFALRFGGCGSTGVTFARFADRESGSDGPYLLMQNTNAARLHALRTTDGSTWLGGVALATIGLGSTLFIWLIRQRRENRYTPDKSP